MKRYTFKDIDPCIPSDLFKRTVCPSCKGAGCHHSLQGVTLACLLCGGVGVITELKEEA